MNIKEKTPSMYINELSKLFDDRMRKETEKAGIAAGYRRLLFHLARSESATQLELVNLTHLTAPTVSVSLHKMQAQGFVYIENNPDDLRQTTIRLTQKGRELHELVKFKLKETEQIMLTGISDSEKETLIELLKRLRENMLSEAN